jgi:Mn-containing catalase
LQFLMTREITHLKAFMAALDSMGKDPLEIGKIPPTPGIVEQFFNDSTGTGDNGEVDARGPWNEGDDIQFVEAPARMEAQVTQEEVTREINRAVGRSSSRVASVPRSKRQRGR